MTGLRSAGSALQAAKMWATPAVSVTMGRQLAPEGQQVRGEAGNDASSGRLSDLEQLTAGLDWLTDSFELPAGVLYGANGASHAECRDLMDRLFEFERLCRRLDVGLDDFIEACLWHFEHYPHFLQRRRHFGTYAEYVTARRGPLRVPPASRVAGGHRVARLNSLGPVAGVQTVRERVELVAMGGCVCDDMSCVCANPPRMSRTLVIFHA